MKIKSLLILISWAISLPYLSCASHSLRYSALYLDLDGTALDASGTVRPATVQALQSFKLRGGAVGLATGRNYQQAGEAVAAIKPSLPTIVLNGGAIIHSSGSRQTLATLDEVTLRTCREKIAGHPAIRGLVFYFTQATAADRDSILFVPIAADIDLRPNFYNNLERFSADSLVKIVVVCEPSQMEVVGQYLAQLLPQGKIVSSTATTLEIIPPSISKLTAIVKVAKERGIPIKRIAAVGDGENDLEMIAGLGLGVAMSNGNVRVKEAADLIIGTNTSDSIAKLILFLMR